MIDIKYFETLKFIKDEILKSRYSIAKAANKEFLILYYKIGRIISEKVAIEKWGSKTIEKLSSDLHNDLNGLRGFSSTNLKKMRQFYEEWTPYISLSDQNIYEVSLLPEAFKKVNAKIGSLTTDQNKEYSSEKSTLLTNQFFDDFIKLSFTAHYEIISKVKTFEERIYYITKASHEFWSVITLRHHLENDLFNQRDKILSNFEQTIVPENMHIALNSFKDHYLLDFIALSDEESENERVLESKIVLNIKKFLMSLGSDFAFIGNQFRIIVDEEEYFIDLLFFNRRLQALVAFELKTGKFKPEFLGKMNFYLSALDEYIKQEHENSSIGIVLCKEKKKKTVEFAFRDINKAMGVATYKTQNELPEKYKNILPDAETLIKLLD